MSILKSKAFWGFTGTAAAIVSAMEYDRQKTNAIRRAFSREAEQYGQVPLKEGDHERRITILRFAQDGERKESQQEIFHKYAAGLLSKAGVDYQLVEWTASKLDKRYYELKDEQEIKDLPDGQVPVESAKKPPVFTEDNFIMPMAQSWFNKATDSIDQMAGKICEENWVSPAAPSFFTDGIIASSPAVFRALLWAYHDANPVLPQQPRFGMINCDFSSGMMKRLYYRFNRREIARIVGQETMAVIRAQVHPVPLKQVLPAETTSPLPIPLYK